MSTPSTTAYQKITTDRSRRLFQEAADVIPGGVNSPARAFKSVGGSPLFIEEARGSRIRDVDGNEYIDYVGSWGPMLLGHSHPDVVAAVEDAVQQSTSFGAPAEIEIRLARLICDMVPSIDMVRMVNSGTEATMSAVRLARGYTGRQKFIKFEGNYHGHGDFFLIAAGSGAVSLGSPDSPGVTSGNAQDTLLARYNDLDHVRQLVDEYGDDLAAIIVEPVAGNMGCIPPEPGFLEGLRQLCTDNGSVLIFDEVMTGFRLAPGGAQEYYGVTPDLTTLGKIIGGGMPVGAYGGKQEIMEHIAPVGPVYQAGTLSGNPLAMSAGHAVLQHIADNPSLYQALERYGEKLEEGMTANLENAGIDYYAPRVGSMGSLFFTDEKVTDFDGAQRADTDRYARYFHAMLDEGVYLAPSPFECYFFSTAHREEELEQTLEAQRRALAQV